MPIRSTTTRVRRQPPWARPSPNVVYVGGEDPVAGAGCCLLQTGCCLAELLGGCVLVLAFLLVGAGTAIAAGRFLLLRH